MIMLRIIPLEADARVSGSLDVLTGEYWLKAGSVVYRQQMAVLGSGIISIVLSTLNKG